MLCHNSGCDVIRDISFNVDVLYSIMINRVESRYELFYLPSEAVRSKSDEKIDMLTETKTIQRKNYLNQ